MSRRSRRRREVYRTNRLALLPVDPLTELMVRTSPLRGGVEGGLAPSWSNELSAPSGKSRRSLGPILAERAVSKAPASVKPGALAGQSARIVSASRITHCVARAQRKEVLFARDIAGHAGKSPGPYRPKSKIKC